MSKSFSYQYQLWCLALSFLTRIPVRIEQQITDDMLPRASGYFALVGMLIGLFVSTGLLLFTVYFSITCCCGVNTRCEFVINRRFS